VDWWFSFGSRFSQLDLLRCVLSSLKAGSINHLKQATNYWCWRNPIVPDASAMSVINVFPRGHSSNGRIFIDSIKMLTLLLRQSLVGHNLVPWSLSEVVASICQPIAEKWKREIWNWHNLRHLLATPTYHCSFQHFQQPLAPAKTTTTTTTTTTTLMGSIVWSATMADAEISTSIQK
jgi:hypothetical protein